MIADQLGLKVSTVANFFMNARRRSTEKYCDDDDLPPPAAAASGPLPETTHSVVAAAVPGTDWKPAPPQLTAAAAATPGHTATHCQLPSAN